MPAAQVGLRQRDRIVAINGKPVNTVQAIWTRSKNDIKEEEYDEFYKYIGHDQDKHGPGKERYKGEEA